MKRKELIAAVATKTRYTKKVVDEVIAAFTEAVQKTDKVVLQGFGTFEYKTRAARKGRNPQTGKEIQIAASRYLHFKASKAK